MLSCFSHVRLFATPLTVACQAPLSMGFSWQEYWSGLPFPSPGDLYNSGIKPESPVSPALQIDFLPLSHYPALFLGFSCFTEWSSPDTLLLPHLFPGTLGYLSNPKTFLPLGLSSNFAQRCTLTPWPMRAQHNCHPLVAALPGSLHVVINRAEGPALTAALYSTFEICYAVLLY